MTGFWDWALEAYARPGAAEACLDLQDAEGANVPLLLWAVWSARHSRAPDAEVIARAAALARRWEDLATGPLRSLRRELKQDVPDVPAADRLAYRDQVKMVELQGERLLMTALEALSTRSIAQGEAEALVAAAAAYGTPLPASRFGGLLACL